MQKLLLSYQFIQVHTVPFPEYFPPNTFPANCFPFFIFFSMNLSYLIYCAVEPTERITSGLPALGSCKSFGFGLNCSSLP